jgi:NAD(P)-dependent dehydrogenase (short-subunit alcohol dehydrogenase family)
MTSGATKAPPKTASRWASIASSLSSLVGTATRSVAAADVFSNDIPRSLSQNAKGDWARGYTVRPPHARAVRLDVLLNNAGIGTTFPTAERAESRDGIELRFAVNFLSHYVLTRVLMPLLKRSAPSRIVNVSSAGQAPIDFNDPMLTRGYTGVRAYCQSKLAQILFTFDLATELAGTGVTVNALHPATYMPTKMVAHPISTIEEGVLATMRLVRDESLADVSGKYFDGARETRAHSQAYDAVARAKLRALSDSLAFA